MAKTKFTPDLPGLIAWLETQPKHRRYPYWDNYDCLLCRFFRAAGQPVDFMGASFWMDRSGRRRRLSRALNEVAVTGVRNYSAALSRARALLAKESS